MFRDVLLEKDLNCIYALVCWCFGKLDSSGQILCDAGGFSLDFKEQPDQVQIYICGQSIAGLGTTKNYGDLPSVHKCLGMTLY